MNDTQRFHPHGSGAWVRLRMSAVALIPLVAWVVYSIIDLRGVTYGDFTLWLQNPFNVALLIVFLLVSIYHAALGTQEVIEDYVHDEKCQKASIVLLKVALFALALISILSIVKVAF